MGRCAAITIDVDSLRFYSGIHGLAAPALEADPIYTRAMPRFFELLDEVGVPATLFLVGEDAPRHADRLAPLLDLGCEVASHSFGHDYRLFERHATALDDDLVRAERALAPLAGGQRIVGFRAPGYNTSPALMRALLRRGYAYDSSLLPAPAYWTARAAAITGYRARGRRSASRIGDLRAFAGPLSPYRTEPGLYWSPRADGRVLELPMACVPKLRVPIIGTSWVLAPRPARRVMLAAGLRGLEVFNFEMHAIDLLDGEDPGVPPELVAAQPDLRVPVADKLDAFRSLFAALRADRDVHTLAHIARER